MPRTKIVCTIGPSSESPEALREMIDAGTDVGTSPGSISPTARRRRTAKKFSGSGSGKTAGRFYRLLRLRRDEGDHRVDEASAETAGHSRRWQN